MTHCVVILLLITVSDCVLAFLFVFIFNFNSIYFSGNLFQLKANAINIINSKSSETEKNTKIQYIYSL